MATGLTAVTALMIPGQSVETNILISFGCLVGLFVYPDLDVNTGNYGNYLIRAIFGPLVEKLWRIYWWPYSRLMYHRSLLSHLPVLSTLVRASYFGVPLFVVMWLFGVEWSDSLKYVFLGMVIIDTVHAIMDIVSTKIKRIF